MHASALASVIQERLNADMTQTDLAITWNSEDSIFPGAAAVDAAGAIYVVGGFSGAYLNVSDTLYTPYNGGGTASEYNNFLIKFNSAGIVDWVNVRMRVVRSLTGAG